MVQHDPVGGWDVIGSIPEARERLSFYRAVLASAASEPDLAAAALTLRLQLAGFEVRDTPRIDVLVTGASTAARSTDPPLTVRFPPFAEPRFRRHRPRAYARSQRHPSDDDAVKRRLAGLWRFANAVATVRIEILSGACSRKSIV